MKNLLLLLFSIFVLFIGCDEDNKTPSFNTLSQNEYLPFDINDKWIYKETITTYNDIIEPDDSVIPPDVIIIDVDTVTISSDNIIGGYEVTTLFGTYFHTQENRIQIIIPGNAVNNSKVQAIDLFYTNTLDTNWTVNLQNDLGEIANLNFKQEVIRDSLNNIIEGVYNVKFFFPPPVFPLLFKFNEIHFKKDIGVFKAAQFNPFGAIELELLEFIDN